MPDDIESLINAFGNAVVRKDHEALDVLLAPWITVNDALETIQGAVNEIAEAWELTEGGWPKEFSGGANPLSYDELSAANDFPPGQDIPAQVTADNYAGWICITLAPRADDTDFEFDAYCDAWCAAVRLADGLHVGSLEVVDPD